MNSTDYLLEQSREYALYTLLDRAIPHIADGLKPGERRVLFVGRNGQKSKVAALAGNTMYLHPHKAPSDSINTLTAPFVNNIPLFDGYGAFGTLANPKTYGADRYVSVAISAFTKKVLFADIELVNMVNNYDDSDVEPEFFLPIIPIQVINPRSGMATGYNSEICPRDLNEVVDAQLAHLAGKPIPDVIPYSRPIDQRAVTREQKEDHAVRWTFDGKLEYKNTGEVLITALPLGTTHSDLVATLDKLMESEYINDYIDDTKSSIKVRVKFKRGSIDETMIPVLKKKLGLMGAVTERINLIGFDSNSIVCYEFKDMIRDFTDWRFAYYTKRYERLVSLLDADIQKYKDIISAIDNNVAGLSRRMADRSELKEMLDTFEIVNIDYIADLPVYRFTVDEKTKTEQKLLDAQTTRLDYLDIIANDDRRKAIYIAELKQVKKEFGTK